MARAASVILTVSRLVFGTVVAIIVVSIRLHRVDKEREGEPKEV